MTSTCIDTLMSGLAIQHIASLCSKRAMLQLYAQVIITYGQLGRDFASSVLNPQVIDTPCAASILHSFCVKFIHKALRVSTTGAFHWLHVFIIMEIHSQLKKKHNNKQQDNTKWWEGKEIVCSILQLSPQVSASCNFGYFFHKLGILANILILLHT